MAKPITEGEIPKDFIEAVRLMRKFQKDYMSGKDLTSLQNARLVVMIVDKKLEEL